MKDATYWKSIAETRKHIARVGHYIRCFTDELGQRAEIHDESKLSDEEAPTFARYTDKLKEVTYDSQEYKSFLDSMKPALDHHYAHNPHHPEYHEDGIDGMTLVDVVEMFSDWCAAVERHADGDLYESIRKNKTRFDMSPQLVKIFFNTAVWMRVHH